MAAAVSTKVKLDLYPTKPITFTAPVEIPTATGEVLIIEFVFKHRTKKQLGELAESRVNRARERFEAAQAEEAAAKAKRDADKAERAAAAKAAGEEPEEEAPTFPATPKFVDAVIDEIAESVEGILEIAEGWNVEGYEFNATEIGQLCDLHGAAANRISETYRKALAEGRLGNSKR